VGVGPERAPGTTARQGGTLRIVTVGEFRTPDPAITPAGPGGWGPLWYGLCATLMAFRDLPAPSGRTVEPEAAVAPPSVSRDGRTYTFIVRRGLRFSDGTPLTAKNFAHALGRVRDPAMRSAGASLFSDVENVDASRRRLVIKLRKPSGDLPMRLALQYACPVPLNFPVDPAGVELTDGSGPYYIAGKEPGKQLVLERNRYYRGTRPRVVDRVVITFSGDLASNIAEVAEGRADILATEIAAEYRDDLARRYGVNKSQFFRTRGWSIRTIAFNTSRPLFRNNAPLRKAINLALDRTALGGEGATDQILTHWMPGWVDHRNYPLAGPKLRLARDLAKGSLRTGKAVLWAAPGPARPLREAADHAEVIRRNLEEIGLEVEVQTLSNAVADTRASIPGAPYDMILRTWVLNYPDPADLIIRLLGGENASKPAGNTNHAYFDVSLYNRRMAAADRLAGPARARAFSELDRDIMVNAAPWAPLFEGSSTLFVSTRVGCLKTHPVFRLDYAAVCVRRG
jgi:peptide/nickel transport system substrate-binding protein